MIEEKKALPEDPEFEKLSQAFRLVTSSVDKLADAGVRGSKKSYYCGKLEVYKRMLDNLNKVEQGIDSFFMGSLWSDIKHSRFCSLRGRASGQIQEPRRGHERDWQSDRGGHRQALHAVIPEEALARGR